MFICCIYKEIKGNFPFYDHSAPALFVSEWTIMIDPIRFGICNRPRSMSTKLL